jgi:hypothetical protein
MKKLTLMIACIALACNAAFSQKEVKYEKMYYKNTTIETPEATIMVDDAVSTNGETKFKIKIMNKTGDYLIYKPEESKFIIDGKEQKPKQVKWEIIGPNDHGSIVVSLPATGMNKVKSYSFSMDGIYKVAIHDNGIAAPDFKLPPSQNEFKAGSFDVSLAKLDKETDKTTVKFKCTYNGDKIGLVFPSRISVMMPDGKEYASVKHKGKPVFLKKGEEESFTAAWDRMAGGKEMDMQKVDMMMKWNATFTEVTPVKLKSETIMLEFDEATSNEKGK